jgi:hypothetical protein
VVPKSILQTYSILRGYVILSENISRLHKIRGTVTRRRGSRREKGVPDHLSIQKIENWNDRRMKLRGSSLEIGNPI